MLERKSIQQMVLGKLDNYMLKKKKRKKERKKLDHSFTSCTKSKIKMD